MKMLRVRKKLIAIASGLALGGLCYANAASAANATLTWNPSGSVPPLSTAGAFTFDNGTIQDFAAIYLTPTGANTFSATETNFFNMSSFSLGGGTTLTPGLDGQAGATPYSLIVESSATVNNFTCTGAGLA